MWAKLREGEASPEPGFPRRARLRRHRLNHFFEIETVSALQSPGDRTRKMIYFPERIEILI